MQSPRTSPGSILGACLATSTGCLSGIASQYPVALVEFASQIQRGALAQLGEHLLCKQGVIGSIPIRSTITRDLIVKPSGFAIQSWMTFTSFREIHISFMLIRQCAVICGSTAKHDTIQVKYTKPCVHSCTGMNTKMYSLTNQEGVREMYAFDQCRRSSQKDRRPRKKPVFFWIKSSARRAFGGCLGSKRR